MTEKQRILVVEDEEGIRQGLCDLLVYHGYEPDAVESGEEGLQRTQSGHYDLVLLDIMLPGINGFDLCEKIRTRDPRLPIVMLTAKGSEEDILRGFAAGSDDYIAKPFSVRELIARINARLRPREKPAEQAFRFGPWEIDAQEGTATGGDNRVELTPREVTILRILVREAGRIVSRRTLLLEGWEVGNPENLITRTVDMHIAKLRKKIDTENSSLIETVRGRGYRYRQL